jgi:phosphate transport system substrate-binding protein
MVILGQRWAEAFMSQNSDVMVQVTGGGSGTGIAALINGTTDICQSSRALRDKERADVYAKRGVEVVERAVALDAIGVYVHPSNPIQALSIEELRRLYRGEVKRWKELGGPDRPVVLYGRENNSGTYAFFQEHVLGNQDFAPEVQTLAGTSAVVAAVKNDEDGIGYGGMAYSIGVRAVGVKREASSPPVAARLETTQDGSYPLSRSLYFLTAGEGAAPVTRFVSFVLSIEGQKTIEQVGFYPLTGTTGAPRASTP